MARALECGDIVDNNSISDDDVANITVPANLVRYRYSSSQVLSLLMRDLDHSDDVTIDLPEDEEMSDIDISNDQVPEDNQELDQDVITSDDDSEQESVNSSDTEIYSLP